MSDRVLTPQSLSALSCLCFRCFTIEHERKCQCAPSHSFNRNAVDLYSPTVFQLIDKYLQPDPVCQQLHICPVTNSGGRMGDEGGASSEAAPSSLLGTRLPLGLRRAWASVIGAVQSSWSS